MLQKNVLIIASTFPRYLGDSTPSFVLDFARSISKDFNVTVLAPYDQNSLFRENFDGIDVWRFPYFIPKFQKLTYKGGLFSAFKESLLAKLQLPFFLLSELFFALYISYVKNIDLINAHWLFPQGFVAVILKKVLKKKVVITTHGGDVALLNSNLKRLLFPLLKESDKVTFVSPYTLKIAKASLNNLEISKKFRLLPMGIYPPEKIIKNKINSQINLLFIGRLVEIKGLNFLIESVKKLIRKYNIRLVVLGDGPKREEWEKLVRKLDLFKQVSFKGYLTGKQKYKYLRETNCVIVPSIKDKNGHEEGLPVVALEAMSYGKVLIATKTGGLSYLIRSFENGILVSPSNSHEIEIALDGIITNKNLLDKLSSNALSTSKKYYWNVVSYKFQNIAKSLYE